MNNQSATDRHMQPERVKKPSLLQRSWQLMIFDEYGRVIRINHLQRYMKTLGGAAVILLLAALCFAILYIHERSARLESQSSYEQVQEKVSALMNENDALMARLAVLRERVPSAASNPVSDGKENKDGQESSVKETPPAEKAEEKAAIPAAGNEQ